MKAKPTTIVWTRPSIEIIIHELRRKKNLYDVQHADYLNRTKRQQAFESICRVLHDKLSLKVSVGDLKSKIQVLRSQFGKDLRCMKENKKHKPTFWCFKKMEWLKPYVTNRRSLPPPPPASTPVRKITVRARTIEPAPDIMDVEVLENGHEPPLLENGLVEKFEYPSIDNEIDIRSSTTATLEADEAALPSADMNISKMVETVMEQPNKDHDLEDINEQFYETIAITQQVIQNRVAAKANGAVNGKSKTQIGWEGEFVNSQLDLISDDMIRSDTMWEIQCVLRRGIEKDRVLPKRRRGKKRRASFAQSEISANDSCISLDSNDDE